MKYLDLECFGVSFKIRLKVYSYSANRNLYILLVCLNDGFEEPMGVLTVNTGLICPKDCAFVDVNNFPKEILEWLAFHKLAVPTGRYISLGYCEYPEYHFDPKVLRKFDPNGYRAYARTQST